MPSFTRGTSLWQLSRHRYVLVSRVPDTISERNKSTRVSRDKSTHQSRNKLRLVFFSFERNHQLTVNIELSPSTSRMCPCAMNRDRMNDMHLMTNERKDSTMNASRGEDNNDQFSHRSNQYYFAVAHNRRSRRLASERSHVLRDVWEEVNEQR